MLAFLVVAVFAVFCFAWHRHEYLLAVAIGLFGAYELMGPLFYRMDEIDLFINATRLYEFVATPQLVEAHEELIGVFLLFFVISYYSLPLIVERAFSFKLGRAIFRPEEKTAPAPVKRYYFLLLVLLVFGVISVSQDVGTIRLHDYLGYEYVTTPFYSYGTLLIVVSAPLVVYTMLKKQWVLLGIILLACIPLSSQIFISSRRQFFAPIFVFLILHLLYSYTSRKRYFWLLLCTTGAIVFLGLQAQMRILFTGVELTEGDALTSIALQLGEFVAISSTTLYTLAYIDPAFFTDFLHFFVMGVGNMIPFVKFGDLLFPEYVQNIQRMIETVAPVGGLSLIAESYVAAGTTGVAIVAVLSGGLFSFGHLAWKSYSISKDSLSPRLIYFCCLICLLTLKYRSGYTDAFLATVNFSLLYAACMLPSLLARQRKRLTADPSLVRG